MSSFLVATFRHWSCFERLLQHQMNNISVSVVPCRAWIGVPAFTSGRYSRGHTSSHCLNILLRDRLPCHVCLFFLIFLRLVYSNFPKCQSLANLAINQLILNHQLHHQLSLAFSNIRDLRTNFSHVESFLSLNQT